MKRKDELDFIGKKIIIITYPDNQLVKGKNKIGQDKIRILRNLEIK